MVDHFKRGLVGPRKTYTTVNYPKVQMQVRVKSGPYLQALVSLSPYGN